MHSYLKAIGYSNVLTRQEVDELVKRAIEGSEEQCLENYFENTAVMETFHECAKNVGLIVRGEYDSKREFHFEHYAPCLFGRTVSTNEELYVNKRVDTDAYTGMCDDSRLGISLIFYLQNVLDYLQYEKKDTEPVKMKVRLAALAQSGKIILPTYKTEEVLNKVSADNRHHFELVEEARKGNKDAIESLALEEIDATSMVAGRILQEDVFSIVDTSFIPYGSESDIYYVLANITEVEYITNKETKEELCLMQVECNHIIFDICINKNDLLGEPEKGRRFKGTVWMQGKVEFE